MYRQKLNIQYLCDKKLLYFVGVLKPSSSPELTKRPNSASMSVDSDSWLSDAMTASYSSATSMLFDTPAAPKGELPHS